MKKSTKIIVIIGGVYSSLGKGICASSIALILKSCNFKVSCMKLEPYLNVDPGLMSPFQHGEVYVTYDGGETDLDLGNYERFTSSKIPFKALVTSGMVYNNIIKKERNGEYNGKTVQVVPHVTGEFKNRIFEYIKLQNNPDFLIIEVGGTVGDMESLAIIEALTEIEMEIGVNNFLPILCAPLIELGNTTKELKTKPCQHAVRELRHLGINPKMLLLRSDASLSKDVLDKMSLNCHINSKYVFHCPTLESIYLVPNYLFKQNISSSIFSYLGILKTPPKNLGSWVGFTNKIISAKKVLNIAMVGKYMELHDAYNSVNEALKLAGWKNNCKVNIKWVSSDEITNKNVSSMLKGISGVIVPGGFGGRGTDGIMIAIRYARHNKIPFLGICYGMQLATIDFAREMLGWSDANTTEIDPKTKHPIFDYIDGRMRLGEQKCIIENNTFTRKLYSSPFTMQRHRHRWEFNNEYKDLFEQKGFIISAFSNDKEKTAEIIELKNHPYFIGCQFHPEFSCNPTSIDPSFDGFIKAAIKY